MNIPAQDESTSWCGGRFNVRGRHCPLDSGPPPGARRGLGGGGMSSGGDGDVSAGGVGVVDEHGAAEVDHAVVVGT